MPQHFSAKEFSMRCTRHIAATALAVVIGTSLAPLGALAQNPRVTVAEDESVFTLANGVMTARVSKKSGDLVSLQYKGTDMLNAKSGHAGGYWSHDTTGGVQTITKITIDPVNNSGERAEVSVKGISGGKKMGHGPGAAQGGDFPMDIEIRYALRRGDSGLYTYCTFDHLPEYPAATMTEARFAAKRSCSARIGRHSFLSFSATSA